MNLFTSTQNMVARSLEDHLTEFIAAALTLNAQFRVDFCEILLANSPIWPPPPILSVETQVSYPDAGCRPDIRLTLANGRVILCENKIEAIETAGKDETKEQIDRYLELPVDGVVYIRGSWDPPAKKVTGNPKYIRPANREHFLWRDFYKILRGDVFLAWIAGGFERMGFTPPLPSIGDLKDPEPVTRERNKRNFAKLWSLTRTQLQMIGWNSQAGSIIELYIDNQNSKWTEKIFISPGFVERFLVRITPRADHIGKILDAIKEATSEILIQPKVATHKIKRTRGLIDVVDIETSLFEVLGKSANTESMEKTLWEYVGSIIKKMK